MALWRVRTEFVGVQGSPWLNTLMFGTANTAQQSVNAVAAFWGAVDNQMSTAVTWRTLADVDEIGVGGELVGVTQTTPANGSGALAGDRLPPATQALVTWRTGAVIAGRELKGRTFIPGLTEGANDATGSVTVTVLGVIQTAADALIADVNSAFTIWSREHGQVRLAIAASISDRFAVLRSRRD